MILPLCDGKLAVDAMEIGCKHHILRHGRQIGYPRSTELVADLPSHPYTAVFANWGLKDSFEIERRNPNPIVSLARSASEGRGKLRFPHWRTGSVKTPSLALFAVALFGSLIPEHEVLLP